MVVLDDFTDLAERKIWI